LREPSSSKPYEIRPIEDFIENPAVIAVVAAYANGDLPPGAAQAAVWNLNSEVSWDDLAAKQTGTARSAVREPYFSAEEIRAAMAIASEAQQATAHDVVTPRNFELPKDEKKIVEEVASPGEEHKAEKASSADDDAKAGAEGRTPAERTSEATAGAVPA
jgi:hypothetical protein